MRSLTILPPPDTGDSQTNAVITRTCPEAGAARELYRIVFNRFNTVHEWSRYMKEAESIFTLCNNRGERVMRLPRKGDYLRMDIAGEHGFKGSGYYWFLIEAAGVLQSAAADEGYYIRLHTSAGPDIEKNTVAFIPPAPGNGILQIRRTGNAVTVRINMPPSGDALPFEKAAAWQWNKLAAGLLQTDQPCAPVRA
ncbi:hypothetical protein [Sediminibacterium ginsengisoli]|uniref:Activator of Hsp90 ATPase homolog 1-like protein n=1 Tax=Sediminibacterium ginsengisoli TaxID=413434 RepID=A0A1T4RL52_9BACT|nr:hypothetical protein [Sediminibacterium ginsengisoli]SKA16720.1 hypothetical protein SAMN04488132_11338 [Sediminibacterium ginsengisoli]